MSNVNLDSVKGVIFDLDGTLYRMRWFMRPLLLIKLFPHFLRLPHFLAERSQFAGKDLGSRDELLNNLCQTLSARERTSAAVMRNWILNRFYPAFIGGMHLQRSGRPLVGDTLRHLHNQRIKLAVLSDYHAVEERLKKLKLPTDCFDTIASCEYSGALKPSPRPFTDVAEQWKMKASSILVVGDREDTDGKAAQQAGMQFLLISDRRKPAFNACCWNDARLRLMEITAANK